jgi:hypothetical protein
MWRIAILLLVACSDPPRQAFVVDGFVDVTTSPNASVIGVWEIAGTPPKYYKHGDGVRLNRQFTLGFETDPPAAALNPDGVGVAFAVMLPELTTLPDGPLGSLSSLPALGISSDTAIVYRTATSDGPAWADALPPRFSCVQCVRDGTGLDTYVLAPCASVLIEGPASARCTWF